jgi:hypothetical protein
MVLTPRPAASLTNFIHNVSSNKGVLIADIYIRTTVYINLKNIPHSPRGIEIGPRKVVHHAVFCKYYGFNSNSSSDWTIKK